MSRPGYIALTIKCGAFKLKEGTWPQYCCCYLSPCLCPGYKKFLCGIVFVFFCSLSCIIDDDYGRSYRTPCEVEFTYASHCELDLTLRQSSFVSGLPKNKCVFVFVFVFATANVIDDESGKPHV